MANGASLSLGAQMAIVYVGINVFFSVALSAVLSLLVLVIVQFSRVIKQSMGKLISRDSVTPLGKAGQVGDKDREPPSDISTTGEEVDFNKGEKRIKWADVRKRRPSRVSLSADLLGVAKTRVSGVVDPPVTRSADNKSATSIAAESALSTKAIRNRKSFPKSGTSDTCSINSPETKSSRKPLVLGKESNSWAFVSPCNPRRKDKDAKSGDEKRVQTPESEYSRTPREDVVSPSSCRIDGLSPSEQKVANQKASVFDSDMKAYEIW